MIEYSYIVCHQFNFRQHMRRNKNRTIVKAGQRPNQISNFISTMRTFTIELRKEKRTGVIPLMLAVGTFGAAYAFVFFLVRKDTLLNLPLAPMDGARKTTCYSTQPMPYRLKIPQHRRQAAPTYFERGKIRCSVS